MHQHEPPRAAGTSDGRARRSPALGVAGLVVVALAGLVANLTAWFVGGDVAPIIGGWFDGVQVLSITSIVAGVVAAGGWVLCLVAVVGRRGRVPGAIGLGLGVLGAGVSLVLVVVSMLVRGF